MAVRALPAPTDWRWLLVASRALCYAWIIGFGLWVWSASPGSDAHAYWAADYADPYRFGMADTDDAYLYSPAFLQALWPLKLLPWPAFWFAWVAMMLAGITWLARPYIAALALIPIEQNPVFTEVWYGNIVVLLALMIVFGFRYPGAWALGFLTKVSSGIGVLYFVGRREWRAVGIALGVTALIVVISAILSPQAWFDWVSILWLNAMHPPADQGDIRLPPLLYRLILSGVLVLVAGWRGWPMLVPLALVLALPVFWFATLTVMLAWFRLIARS